MQKPHSPERAFKVPHVKRGGKGPTRETCVNYGGLTAMVPCLHQSSISIKRKLRVWKGRKCIHLVSAKKPSHLCGPSNYPISGRWYGADKGNLHALGWTYHHGTVFAPRQYLYQKEATGMERLEMYFPSRCKNPTHLCGPLKYPSQGMRYRAEK